MVRSGRIVEWATSNGPGTPLADILKLSGRLGFRVGRGAHEIALRCCCCNGAGVAGRNRAAEILSRLSKLFFSL